MIALEQVTAKSRIHKGRQNQMSQMRKKIQHWSTNICGYNCKIEYTEGKRNVCADMLLWLLHRQSHSNDDNELSGPDITDETFEVIVINSSNINPKAIAQYDHQVTDNQCT